MRLTSQLVLLLLCVLLYELLERRQVPLPAVLLSLLAVHVQVQGGEAVHLEKRKIKFKLNFIFSVTNWGNM